MDINYIVSFLSIVHYGSYKNAADALFITQPTLSSRIQALEKELGKKLFVRNKRGATLTEDGLIFLPYAQQLVDTFERAKMEVGQLPREITIGAIMSVSTQLLPKIMTELKQRKPHVTVKIRTGFTSDLVQMVKDGSCSFAIVQHTSSPELVSIPFYKDPISLFVPKGHKFEHTSATIEQIAKEPMIAHEIAIYWAHIKDLFRLHNLNPNFVFNINSLDACKHMVTDGLGIAFMPELSLESSIRRGEICRVNTPEISLSRTLSIIYRSSEEPPPYLDQIMQIMKQLNFSSNIDDGTTIG